MRNLRRKKLGLAMAVACSATIASEAAVIVTYAYDGANTLFTFTFTEGVYTLGDNGSKFSNDSIRWGTPGGSDNSFSGGQLADTLIYESMTSKGFVSPGNKFRENNIQFTGTVVESVLLSTAINPDNDTNTVTNGAVSFTHSGNLTNLDFGSLTLVDSTFVGDNGNLSAVPEPSTMAFTLLGVSSLLLRRQRRA